jgi:hypothetical protein
VASGAWSASGATAVACLEATGMAVFLDLNVPVMAPRFSMRDSREPD